MNTVAKIKRPVTATNNEPEILFHLRVSRILGEATQIASCANLLAALSSVDLTSSRYDLKASARYLREAADKLDAISSRGE